MSTNRIIIKASDYRYPSREELLEVYKKTPDLPNFGFVSEKPITSIIQNKRSLIDVHKDDNLQYWNNVLLNRNGAMVEIPINLTPSRQFQIDPQSCCLKQAEVVVQKGILE
jgi:hypothetical protein